MSLALHGGGLNFVHLAVSRVLILMQSERFLVRLLLEIMAGHVENFLCGFEGSDRDGIKM